MFIAPATQRSLRSGGAKCLNLLDIDGAPSEREALINQNYKHLAALRPCPRLLPRTLEQDTSPDYS
jgi:hypothetical protein